MSMGNIAGTGMQASMEQMDIISNNIANSSTTGFKSSTASFGDIFPSGGSSDAIGLGVRLTSIEQDFSPGSPTATNIASNLAISGNGFFILQDSSTGITSYSRNGQFNFDEATGYFTMGNQLLQGFAS